MNCKAIIPIIFTTYFTLMSCTKERKPDMIKPTFEQQELLSNIVNTRQRDALLTAIANGETIPTYAWTPVPAVELTDEAQNIIDDATEAVREESERTNRSFDDTLGDLDLSWKVTDLLDRHQEDEIINEGFTPPQSMQSS